MTLTTYEQLEQGSEEWLAARCGIITASVIGKLITPTGRVADNDTSRATTLNLAAERITGHVEPIYVNADMQRGNDDEPYARDAYSEWAGVTVDEVGFFRLDGENLSIGYSPDGLVGDDGLIEIKSRKQRVQLTTILNDQVPAYNMAQLQAGLYVTGRDWIDYVSYSGGMPLYVKRVHPDPKWFDAITSAATKFEADVRDITNQYTRSAEGMPLTERIDHDQEITVI